MGTDSIANRVIPLDAVSRGAAAALVTAALDAARAAGIEVAVAVTDSTGSLRAFERADGAPFLTAEVAVDKAWTASSYGYPTHVWNQYLADPKVAPLGSHPRLLGVGGGYPIRNGGRLVGGIGVSGGNAEQDQDIAVAALHRVGFDPIP